MITFYDGFVHKKTHRYAVRFAERDLLHTVFVSLDHLFDHVAADRASLLGSDVAVVTIVQVDADLAGSFHLEAIHSITCGRIYEIGTLRHLQASPFSSFGL